MRKPIVFIRHKFPVALAAYLEQRKLIGIEFNAYCFDNFEDYPIEARHQSGFRAAFKTFSNLGLDGALVVAQYNPHQFYLGHVKAGTEIQCVDRSTVLEDGVKYLVKTLKLTRVKGPYNYANYPLLSALRPPFVTIRHLHVHAENVVHHLWDGCKLTCSLNNLHPQMLEQMCDEWLRTKYAKRYRIAYQILKTGKTMPVIDIYAETRSGKTLLVQVTHARQGKAVAKATALKKYVDSTESPANAIALFMGPEELGEAVRKLGLGFVSIEQVFETFYCDPAYNVMLNKMVGVS